MEDHPDERNLNQIKPNQMSKPLSLYHSCSVYSWVVQMLTSVQLTTADVVQTPIVPTLREATNAPVGSDSPETDSTAKVN